MSASINNAYIYDAVRTPIGRYGGALSTVRTDDLAAKPISALMARNPSVDWSKVDEVVLGCVNQSGEDNRNVARMASLLAGLQPSVPGVTVNRLCASGMDAVGAVARGVMVGEYGMCIAGGVEGMTRAPMVMPKATTAFSRDAQVYDTTIGWRFINPLLQAPYGTDSMPQTADIVAREWNISRDDQDAFALHSQQKWARAQADGKFQEQICPVSIPQRRGEPLVFDCDEHPRPNTDLAALARLNPINGPEQTVTAGNASGVNDGSAALLIGVGELADCYGLEPMARIVGMQSVGVEPRTMGIGPAPATRRLLERMGVTLGEVDIIEINEAFASQALACLRDLGLSDDDARVNPDGGAIAMGHPLGMTGARLVLSAAYHLKRSGKRYALCTMCVGVGQGTAMLLERP